MIEKSARHNQMDNKQPLVVMSAPNGARLTQSDHAALPLTSVELANCAEDLLRVGVSVLHLHVRDKDGKHSLDAGRYRSAIDAIQDRVGTDLILQVTTEAVGVYDRHQQMALVRELRPEAVSLALRELCPDDSHLDEASSFFREIVEAGIWPQYILYSAEDVFRFEQLRRCGTFGEQSPFTLFVLGRYSDTKTGDPEQLDQFLEVFEPGAFPWAVCCFGATEHQAVHRAASLGGHARIGFENNQLLPNGVKAQDNPELIKHTLMGIDRPVASADWVRENLF